MADYEDYKEEIGDVLYDYGRGLYANITNRCPCRCEFCIRDMTDSLGSADSLWLKREPTVEEVIAMLKEWDLNAYEEGLSDLINGKETCPMLEGIIDSVSVSLNQSDAEKYTELCHPKFGPAAYDAMLKFTKDVQRYVPHVAMSVVGVIPVEDIEKCREIAAGLGVPFRVR